MSSNESNNGTPLTDDDISLPKATIQKIIQEYAGDVFISKEAKDVIGSCCVEFIHLIASGKYFIRINSIVLYLMFVLYLIYLLYLIFLYTFTLFDLSIIHHTQTSLHLIPLTINHPLIYHTYTLSPSLSINHPLYQSITP